jgi:hypothetical protein
MPGVGARLVAVCVVAAVLGMATAAPALADQPGGGYATGSDSPGGITAGAAQLAPALVAGPLGASPVGYGSGGSGGRGGSRGGSGGGPVPVYFTISGSLAPGPGGSTNGYWVGGNCSAMGGVSAALPSPETSVGEPRCGAL